MNSDVLIIGGGVIGLSIARDLRKRSNVRITVLEKGVTGRESSWAAGGMLGPQAEADEFGHLYGICSRSRDMYPGFAAELLDETGVDIELERSGTLYLALTDADERELEKRLEIQLSKGLSVEKLTAEDIRRTEPFVSPDVRGGLYFEGDWQVENRKLLSALKRFAETNEISIVENTAVERLIVESGRVAGAAIANGEIRAGTTILATGAWTSLIKMGESDSPFAVTPVRGQMIVFQTAKRMFRHVIYSRRGYLVPRIDGRILAGSTSEFVGFEKAVTDEAKAQLLEMSFQIAPTLSNLSITDSWSGLRPYASDGLPILGKLSGIDDLIVATAHYRNGILLAPLTASVITGSVMGETPDPALVAFGPDRFRFSIN